MYRKSWQRKTVGLHVNTVLVLAHLGASSEESLIHNQIATRGKNCLVFTLPQFAWASGAGTADVDTPMAHRVARER